MTAPDTLLRNPTNHLNDLRRGVVYRAITRHAASTGEYLGIETPFGEMAILLRHGARVESIALETITSIRPTAA